MSANQAVALPTITFGTSGVLGEITEWSFTGATRGSEETTHFGVTLPVPPASPGDDTVQYGGRTYLPDGIVDPGGFSGTMNMNVDKFIPLHSPPEVITITHQASAGDATGAIHTFTGFFLTATHTLNVGKLMVMQFTGKISGVVVTTPGTT